MRNSESSKSQDPYHNFKVKMKLNGEYGAGFSKVSALKRSAHPKGYEAITLERGITHDVNFQQWADKASSENQTVSLRDFRKDIILDVFDESGQKALSYKILRYWPSEFSTLPDLDSKNSTIAIQSLKLENEGWERSVTS